MKTVIKQKSITAWFGLALFLIGGVTVLSYWSLTGGQSIANGSNLMLIVAIANSFSVVLLGWVYSRLWRLFANSQRLLNDRGEIYQVLGITHDITERKQMEEALRSSEERSRIALQNSPTVVFSQDAELRYTWVYNANSKSDAEKFIGKSDFELFAPEDAQRLAAIKRRVLTTGVGTREETFFTVNGEVQYYDLTVEPLLGSVGEVVGITCAATNITDIRVREGQLRAIFEGSLDAIAIVDDEGTYIEANPAASQLFGMPVCELLGRRIEDFINPGGDFELAWHSLRKHGQFTGEVSLVRPDGTVRDIEYTAKADFLPGRHLSIVRDITARKQAEQELQRREALLSQILNTLPVGVGITDSQGLILQGNPAGQQIWAGARYVGINQYGEYKGWWPDTGKRIEADEWALARAILNGETSLNELINIECFDGTRKTILNSAMPLRNENQEIIGGLVVNQDITELKQAEAALRESQHLLQKIADTIPNNLYIYDRRQDSLIYANRRTEEFFGCTQAELQAMGLQFIAEFVHPEDIQQILEFHKRFAIAQDNQVITHEFRLKNARGEWRWVRTWEVIFTRTADGKPEQILGVATDITERKQTKEALRETQHLLQQIADTTPSQLYIYDLIQDCNVYANRRTQEFFGCTQAELRAVDSPFLAQIIHPGDFQQVVEGSERFATAKEGEVLEKEFRVKNTWGEWRWLHTWEVIFTRTTDGQPEKLLGTAIDITERKHTEEALRVSEERLRTAMEAAHMGTWEWNILTGQVTWSDNFKIFLGLALDSFEGNYESFIARIHPEDRDRVLQNVERVVKEEVDYEDEFRIILPNGNVRWLASIGQVFYDETGRPVRIAGLDLDISDRKHVELALLEERNCISAILETANALIVVLDEQGRFIRFNRACEQITGYSLEEVKGKCIWDLFLIPEEVEPVQAIVQELQAGQFPNEHENYWVARDGSRRLISWFNTVILDADGSVKYIIGIGIDITDRKQAEEMRRALEREQALSDLRLHFFSMASHEFRTPLSTILLTAQILESSTQGWSEEKRKRNLKRIISVAKEMRQMLDDILTINRAETGRLEFAPTPTELNTFCLNLLEEMRLYVSPQHTLNFSKQSETEWASVDEKLIHCILTNLLSNAIKYSPDGGDVCLVIKRTQEAIIFQVNERGIGICPSDIPHIFEAFHRGKNVDCIPGSGLGLTVAKKCVELHGGSITFTSEVEVGTTFIVTIPRTSVQ